MEGGSTVNVLLDTTVLIDVLKGDTAAVGKVEELRENSVVYTSSVNIYEILRGIKLLPSNQERHLAALRLLISNVHLLEFDLKAAEEASNIYATLRKKGIAIDHPDYLIAGVSLANGVNTIITRNEKHFKKVPGMKVVSY